MPYAQHKRVFTMYVFKYRHFLKRSNCKPIPMTKYGIRRCLTTGVAINRNLAVPTSFTTLSEVCRLNVANHLVKRAPSGRIMMLATSAVPVLFVFATYFPSACASHFGGGIIMWRALHDGSRNVVGYNKHTFYIIV